MHVYSFSWRQFKLKHLKPHKWAQINSSRRQTLTNHILNTECFVIQDFDAITHSHGVEFTWAFVLDCSHPGPTGHQLHGTQWPVQDGWSKAPLPSQVRGTEDYFNYFIQPLWGQISLRPLSDEMNCCPAAVYQSVTQRELASHKAGTQTLTHHYTQLTHTLLA